MEVVLVEPEIPQNTGSIARTCAATGTPLHLVGKLGFEITEKRVRRAGLDYWPYVSLHQHATFENYREVSCSDRLWYFSTKGARSYHSVSFEEGDALVFGSETRGLGEEFLSLVPKNSVIRIPMKVAEVRSLNLSNAVSIALYEALRQTSELGE